MNWSDEVDRAFAQRREELVQELIQDGVRIIDDLGAVASACAASHPLAYIGSGVAAGASITMLRGSPAGGTPIQGSSRRSGLVSTLLGVLRFVPLGAFFG